MFKVYLMYCLLRLPRSFKQLFGQTAEIPATAGAVTVSCTAARLRPFDKPWLRLPDSRGVWHVGEAVAQAYIFVLIPRSIGQLHTKLMALSVQHFWFEP